MINSHGDLVFDNILISDDGITIIDWEDTGVFPFYYDFFNLMIMEEIFQNNSTFSNQLINGDMDYLLEDIFHAAGIDYHPEHIRAYIIIYLVQRLARQKKYSEGKSAIILDYLSKIVEI